MGPRPDRFLDPPSSTFLLNGYGGGPHSGGEADHTPSYSAEFKNVWSYTSTSPTRLHGVNTVTTFNVFFSSV
jgi:hypothetical protein